MTADLTLLHLYPQELGIFGDVGNVLALRRRAEWRGLTVDVVEHHRDGAVPEHVDLVHIGNGARSGVIAVQSDVVRISSALGEWIDADVPVLAVASGWQLLGRALDIEGEPVHTAGVFPSTAVVGAQRRVGNVVMQTADGLAMGFENHAAITTLDEGASPFGTDLTKGVGNGDGTDGVLVRASIGTNLGGPLLPLNPATADRLLAAALARTDRELPPIGGDWAAIADAAAAEARQSMAAAVTGAKGWLVAGS